MSIHVYIFIPIYKKHIEIDSRALKDSTDWIYPNTFCMQLKQFFPPSNLQ